PRNDGFPWGTWAGSLNLFVWLVVGAYLIWGCRKPYRLLGLVVMPLAAALLVVARAGGGTGIGTRSDYSNLFLVLHVGLVLAAFAGFTLAAALSALYLWQERRLKRHERTILRVRAPALAKLDEVAGRTIAFALPALTLGIAVGIVSLPSSCAGGRHSTPAGRGSLRVGSRASRGRRSASRPATARSSISRTGLPRRPSARPRLRCSRSSRSSGLCSTDCATKRPRST